MNSVSVPVHPVARSRTPAAGVLSAGLILGFVIAGLAPLPGRADERLAGRACRSVHLQFPGPEAVFFLHEMEIVESQRGSYFMAAGFDGGYFGMQELYDGRKVILFSVWDRHAGDHPGQVPEEKRVRMLYKDDAVRVGRFGGEGTGGQSFFDYDWKTGVVYRFAVHAEVHGDRTAFTGFFFHPESAAWKRLVTFDTLGGGRALGGYHCFVEDFLRNRVSATQPRRAYYGNGRVQTRDGTTAELLRAQFTADGNPATNINAGVEGGRFFLATGGETRNTGTPLWKTMARPAAPEAKTPDWPPASSLPAGAPAP